MPERYDKTVFAAELKVRDQILAQIRSAWTPVSSFEIPIYGNENTRGKNETESVSEGEDSNASDGALPEEEIDIAKLED